jgi:class 3 adenylate cyclase
MAVFMGNSMNTSAVRTALKIHFAVQDIVTPAIRKQYQEQEYAPKHVAGIDTSKLLVAKTGVRGTNDLVWVGRAANYAAKLASLPHDYAAYITEEVYKGTHTSMLISQGREMWEARTWTAMHGKRIYRSNYWLSF